MSAGDREAESQGKKGEDGSSTDDSRGVAALRHALEKNWSIGLRVIEMILAIIAVGLLTGALAAPQVVSHNNYYIAHIYSAYSSFIIITGVLIAARLFGETVGWKTSIGFSVVGFCMFTAAAAIIFYNWYSSYYANIRPNKEAYNLLIASGVFAIIDAAVFLLHVFLSFKKEAHF